MKVWQVTYYRANKYGSMQEYVKQFPASLTSWEVRSKMDRWMEGERAKGRAVYPQYDMVEDEIAA